jgi:FtsH-binding integral membrane protein
MPMNPLASVSWFWRVWRTRSITFAALFATSLLGVSVLGAFRRLLRGVGAPWYVWLVVPFVVVWFLARKEERWMSDPAERRTWALRIVVGAIVLSLLVAKLGLRHEREAAPPPAGQNSGRADPHGR